MGGLRYDFTKDGESYVFEFTTTSFKSKQQRLFRWVLTVFDEQKKLHQLHLHFLIKSKMKENIKKLSKRK